MNKNQSGFETGGIRKLAAKPESITFLIMVIVLVALLISSENFRDAGYIVKAASRYVEFGFVALAMTYVIISGMIDLSVASAMALCATISGWAFVHWGLPMGVGILLGIILGAVLGFLNGVLIAKGRIQPMIVTIGTMSLYRGIAQIMIGDQSLGKFPEWFNSVDKAYLFQIGNVKVSITLVLFAITVIIMLLILKYTSIGRKVYGIGTNEQAVRYSGVNVERFKICIMTLSGVFSALAGILTMSRLLVVRYDMATGGELDIITIVLLGGASINGGKGSIIGTIFGWLTIVFVKSGMSVAGIDADFQTFIMGALLLFSIIFPQVISKIRTDRMEKKAKLDAERIAAS